MYDTITNYEAECIAYGEPVETADPDTVPTPEDDAWYVWYVMSGEAAQYDEDMRDWLYGQSVRQADYWNNSL